MRGEAQELWRIQERIRKVVGPAARARLNMNRRLDVELPCSAQEGGWQRGRPSGRKREQLSGHHDHQGARGEAV